VLLGALLAVLLFRWQNRRATPRDTHFHHPGLVFARAANGFGGAIQRTEARLRQWPAATMSLLFVAIRLGAAMLVGR